MSLHQILLFVHLLSVAVVLGMGFTNIIGFRVARNVSAEMAQGIAKLREASIMYADIFVTLLVLAGLGLLWNRGGTDGLSFWFQIKMAAVVVWLGAFIFMRVTIARFLKSRDMSVLPRIRMLAHTAITGAVVALFCAVMTFAG